MGLGLSALTALLLLLPGIAFVFGLNRVLSPASPPSPFAQHFSVELIFAIFAAVFLHLLGVALVHGMALLGWSSFPAAAHALLLLAGDLKAPAASAALRGVENHPIGIGFYFLLLTLAGYGLGRLVNRLVPRRSHSDWAELLSGRFENADGQIAFVVLTTEVFHGDATWLYSGYLDDYLVDREGRLERVVFRGYAARRLLRADEADEPQDDPTFVAPPRWTEIPGEIFVLQMSNARTINVDYFFEEEDQAANATPVAA